MAEQHRSISERSKALICRNLFSEESELLRLGRFDLVRTIGRGGSGVVYEAIDSARSGRVALKTLHRNGPSQLYRLKREFRSLAELTHPNLVALHELHVTPREAYFTMDLVNGRDFVSAIRHGTPLGARLVDEGPLSDALVQLCAGVHALHQANKLHRDLKPANVLVTNTGRVVLLDFGLVHDSMEASDSGEGTPGYMAPEQKAGSACPASDWYAVGRILQQALCVRQPARPEEEQPQSTLEALSRQLVQLDPAARPRFQEIESLLRRASPQVLHAATLSSRPRVASFEGRATELERLGAVFVASRRAPAVVLVRGQSGVGKSTLLREFASRELEPRGALVLRGRCYERESVPYKAFDAVIDELSRYLVTRTAEEAPTLPAEQVWALLQMFPVLGRVPWLRRHGKSAGAAQTTGLRIGGVDALKALFAWLATERPLTLLVDDLQWADADSGRLLAALLCDEDSPAMLMVASDRSDPRLRDGAADSFQKLADGMPQPVPLEVIDLTSLTPDETLALARRLLPGEELRAYANDVARESRGNPLFVTELARWVAGAVDAGGDAAVPRVDVLFEQRRARLHERSRPLLELMAAAGRPLTAAVLQNAAAMLEEPVPELDELRAAHLVCTIGSGEGTLFHVAHDRIAEAVLEPVREAGRIALHQRLARAFEASEGEDSEALMEQYIGARMPHEAARSARKAATRAMRVFAFARAATLCEQALSLGSWTEAEQANLHGDHAIALEQIGRGVEAARAYERAAAASPERAQAAHFVHHAVQRLLHSGRYQEGEALLRRGYQSLGLGWPESRLALVLGIAYRTIPRRLREPHRPNPETFPLERTRAEFLAGAGRGIENYDALRAIYNALLCFDSGERLPDPLWHARAAGARGMMRCMALTPGGGQQGIRELAAACAVARSANDDAAIGDLEGQHALALYMLGEPQAALDAAIQSEICVRRLPVPSFDLQVVAGLIGTLLVVLGRLREARRRWDAVVHETRQHRDLRTMTYVHGHPSRIVLLFASEEKPFADELLDRLGALRKAHPDYLALGYMNATAGLEAAFYWGTPDDIAKLAARETQVLFGTGYGMLSKEARFLRARVRLVAASRLPDGAARARLLREAARDAHVRGRGAGPWWQARVLLLEAGIANVGGRPDLALTKLDASIEAMHASGAALTAESAKYCRGLLVGGDAGRVLTQEAAAALRAQGVAEPRRWVDWIACGFRHTTLAST